MALRVRRERLPYDTAIRTEGLFDASQLLSELTGEPVQANKAIVGRNAFAHEAGIHQDGMLKDTRTYEIMRPEDVGQSAGAPRARPPLGAPRRAAPLRRSRPRRLALRARSRSTAPSSTWASAALPIGDARSAPHRRAAARDAGEPARRRTRTTVGYGHGV